MVDDQGEDGGSIATNGTSVRKLVGSVRLFHVQDQLGFVIEILLANLASAKKR